MQPPCEVMVSDFLPNIRGLVSHEMHERGESQRQIAVRLGVTQARVSYYLSINKGKFITKISNRFGIPPSEAQSYARILAEDVGRSQTDGIFTLYSIWKNLLFTGEVCSIHHQKNSSIPPDCSVCMDLHRPYRESSASDDKESEDSTILREISEAASLIEASASFPSIMPEVSVNIAMSRNNPKSSRDIGAIPGRVNRIHGRAKALMLPEFGCSKHMSNVLLVLKSKNRGVNSIMNLKYDQSVDKAITSLGIAKVFTQLSTERKGGSQRQRSSSMGDPVIDRLMDAVLPEQIISNPIPFAVIDRGSEGVEPITYLAGRRATEVAQTALKISHLYGSLQSGSN